MNLSFEYETKIQDPAWLDLLDHLSPSFWCTKLTSSCRAQDDTEASSLH